LKKRRQMNCGVAVPGPVQHREIVILERSHRW
jgi:hypothetical protein